MDLRSCLLPSTCSTENFKNSGIAVGNSILPDGVYHIQNGVISAHPEIFKVKMLAKRNVKTISTMSSSNYDNSDNSSNIGGGGWFKAPRGMFYERDILTECQEDRGQEINDQLDELLKDNKLQNKSKDDEWMIIKQKEDFKNEYLWLIRDSPFLLQRSFLYNKESDQLKAEEKDKIYETALERVKVLFQDENELEEPDFQNNEIDESQFSPMKEFNEVMCEETFSMCSDSKNWYKNNDNMDCDENSSFKDESLGNYNNSYCENRSFLSHSSYGEDIEPEIRDILGKDSFRTPRKMQKLSYYDQNVRQSKNLLFYLY